MKIKEKSREELKLEVERLRAQLAEAEETLRAIRSGEVDALVVSGEKGEQVFTLKGAEQPYRILIEEMSEGAAMLTADDSILYCNSGFANMLKTPLEKIMGTGISQFVSPADKQVFEELLSQGRESGGKGEIIFMAGDGTGVPVHLSVNAMLLDGLSTTYLVATDITEIKLAEEALQKAHDELEIKVEERTTELRESEQRYATTLASIGDAVIATDAEGRITFMNAVAEELTGWSLPEASTRPVTEVFSIINEQTRQTVEDPVARVLEKGLIVGLANHTILVRKDGTEMPIDDSGAPIRDGGGKTMGAVLVFRDITERKRAEEELRQNEERFKSLAENVPSVLMRYDKNLRVVYLSPRAEEITGIPVDEFVGKTNREVGMPEHLCMLWENAIAEVFRTGQNMDMEFDFPSEKGVRTFYLKFAPEFDPDGTVGHVLGISTEITERKRAEEELRKAHDELELRVRERTRELQEANKALLASEASYRELTESIDDLFYAMDGDLRYTYWNKASEALTGIQAKDAIGKSLYELFPDVKGTKAEQFYIEVLRAQQPGRLENEYRLRDKKFIFEINAYPTGSGLSVIAKDITEKKKLESQLLRAQRLESIGTLAGGIAHDLNNMLTPMMMSLHMLKEKFKDEQSRKLLNILEQNSQRSADLIKQVLSFARGVEGERNPLQAKHLISEIKKILKETFPRNIEIMTDVQKDLYTISGDATQLHQVIMNLCVNARDAMLDGGILDITASNFFIDENYTRRHPETKVGPYVSIAVSDTGTGISPDIMDRIFEPFFTTKEFGKGTGLGLSTALSIVKSHGGFINVYSEVGKGSTFRVYLPAIKTGMQHAEKAEAEMLLGHGELVLVAEDEDSIREITVSTLKEYGYEVLTANDGAQAVALYAQNKDKINVTLMDIMMPVMDGHASISAIRRIDPGAKIIAVSGLAEKDKLAKIADIRVHAFLQKPYTAEKLLKTICEVLGGKKDGISGRV